MHKSVVARNIMKMRPANRISEISAAAQHFLQDCMCAQRSSKESLDVWFKHIYFKSLCTAYNKHVII